MKRRSLKMLSLFSGVGMIDLAASWAGIETVAMCEIQPYPQKILRKRFPEAIVYDDIFKLTAERIRNDGIAGIDIIAGGFPCQPFSVAGNREGEGDERHLWPEMYRLICELEPRWVLGENVPGLLSIADVRGRRGELSEAYSETWPKFGMMQSGQCTELTKSALHIKEKGSSYWPTPLASDGTMGAIIGREDTFRMMPSGVPRKINRNGTNGSIGLARLVQMMGNYGQLRP